MKKIFLITIMILLLFSLFFINIKHEKKTEVKNESFYIEKNKNRYLLYKNNNKSLSDEEVIIHVNIGLDRPFYSNTRETVNLGESILVNKYNYLSKDYIPKNLKKIDNTTLINYVCDAFNAMKNDIKENNLNIIAVSGYRSFEYQDKLYKRYERYDGREKADTYSARAGYSEHQTGLAVDVSNGELPYTQFENTEEYKWMTENAYKYGFILRYPKNKDKITGYIFESWHFRYVGVKVSSYIKKHNITFDEYYAKFIEPNL